MRRVEIIKRICKWRNSKYLPFQFQYKCLSNSKLPFPFPFPFPYSLTSYNFSFSPFNYNPYLIQARFCTRHYSSSSTDLDSNYEAEQNLVEEWEEENETEPEYDDGGAGGGVVLQNVPWGERVLSLAREVLLPYGDDIKLFAFKSTPRGYIYVRLDQLSKEYGCPGIELLESYNREYKKVLEEAGSKGEIPDDLALEVSSPGAERLLRVPNDLLRFKDFPLLVSYIEEGSEAKFLEKSGVFLLDSIETESKHCVWKLADVRANRDPDSKGRPMSRKRKDWRLKLQFSMLKKVALHLDF